MTGCKVLIVDDIEEYLRSLKKALSLDFEVLTAHSLVEGKEKMDSSIALALVDICLREEEPSNRDGFLLLQWIKRKYDDVPVIMMSAFREFDIAVDSLNLGASYFLRKPVNLIELKSMLRTFAENRSSGKELRN